VCVCVVGKGVGLYFYWSTPSLIKNSEVYSSALWVSKQDQQQTCLPPAYIWCKRLCKHFLLGSIFSYCRKIHIHLGLWQVNCLEISNAFSMKSQATKGKYVGWDMPGKRSDQVGLNGPPLKLWHTLTSLEHDKCLHSPVLSASLT